MTSRPDFNTLTTSGGLRTVHGTDSVDSPYAPHLTWSTERMGAEVTARFNGGVAVVERDRYEEFRERLEAVFTEFAI